MKMMQRKSRLRPNVWNRSKDVFTFEMSAMNDYCTTMRHQTSLKIVLSITTRVYDVLCLVSPVAMTARLIIQKIWKKRLERDQKLPLEVKTDFWTFVDSLKD